jgi:hypothetical protein
VKSKSLKAVVCKLVWGSSVYNLWRYRNDLKFGNQALSEDRILQRICREFRTCIVGERKFQVNEKTVAICNNWGSSHNILVCDF